MSSFDIRGHERGLNFDDPRVSCQRAQIKKNIQLLNTWIVLCLNKAHL